MKPMEDFFPFVTKAAKEKGMWEGGGRGEGGERDGRGREEEGEGEGMAPEDPNSLMKPMEDLFPFITKGAKEKGVWEGGGREEKRERKREGEGGREEEA
jgi:hypothetical protein